MAARTKIFWLLSLLPLVLLLSGLELFLALQYGQYKQGLLNKYQGRENCTRKSELRALIYEGIPGKCGLNSFGYGDIEVNQPKKEGVYRIVIIGDSIAAGQGVKREEKFASVLRKLLSRNSESEKSYEVYALAMSGYSTNQELEVLDNQALGLNPDLIVWSYVLNDPADPVFHDANGELGRYFYEPRSHLLHFVLKRAFKLREKKLQENCRRGFHHMLHCVYRTQVEEHVAELGRFSREHSVPVLFSIHPNLVSFEDYRYEDIHRFLSETAVKNNLQVVDFLDEFRRYRFEKLQVSKNDQWHPNALGHRLIAESLYREIQAGGL